MANQTSAKVTNGTTREGETVYGIDELQKMANVFANTSGNFTYNYTLDQLVLIYRAYQRSEWDITPDYWTSKEVADALEGKGCGAEGECLCVYCRDARPVGDSEACEACAKAEHEHDTIADDD